MADKNFVVKNSLIVGDTATINGVQIDPSGASSNQVLKFDGTKFAPASEGDVSGATISSTAPVSPQEGAMWFDSDTAQTFVYYDSQWIEIGASGMAATISDTAPSSPIAGQVWFNSLNGGTYVYYSSVWTEVGAVPINALLNTINAKGDLIVGTADNTVGGLTAGSANQVLTVDSTTATGLKWSTPTVYQAVVTNVSDTEIGYLDGVTSAIQTQLGTKASTGKAIAMSIVFGG